jgi:hypothetical protein
MTRIEKSDAQLDAEAAEDLSRLPQTVALHRAMWRDDNRLERLVSRQPPLTRYEKTDDPELIRYGANDEYVIERGAIVGMPMSGNMIRRLSENPGELYPWVAGLNYLKTVCRRRHPDHRSLEHPYWRGALCWTLVRAVVIDGLSIQNAAAVLRADDAERILAGALALIEESIDDNKKRAEKRARLDEGQAVTCRCGHAWSRHGGITAGFRCLDECDCARYMAYMEPLAHHVPSEEHRAECPQCQRASAA